MKTVEMNKTIHEWEKKNLTTLWAKTRGCYDIYQCKHCGIKGRSYRFGMIEIQECYSKRIDTCNRPHSHSFVKVINCRAFGDAFKNITDGSIHQIIAPPKGQDNKSGEWVMGNGEPVLLLWGEFKYQE